MAGTYTSTSTARWTDESMASIENGVRKGDWSAQGGSETSTFVFIRIAGDVGWYWHLVEAELRERGHDVVAPDLPCAAAAALPEYADAVAEAFGDRTDLVVVAQSLGGFTARSCANVCRWSSSSWPDRPGSLRSGST